MNRAFRAAGLWGPVALLAALITWISHIPNLAPPGDSPDWVMHVGEYGLLALLVGRAMTAGRGMAPGRAMTPARAMIAAAACLAFGAADEVHQTFVVGRSGSVRDWLFDLVGVALGLAAVAIWRRMSPSRAPEVTLVGRAACHLCEEAERVMRPVLAEMGIGMSKVDVDGDELLATRYGHEVPVVLINGRKAFKHRVDPARLRRKLASAPRGRA
jgi:VanZ family protein